MSEATSNGAEIGSKHEPGAEPETFAAPPEQVRLFHHHAVLVRYRVLVGAKKQKKKLWSTTVKETDCIFSGLRAPVRELRHLRGLSYDSLSLSFSRRPSRRSESGAHVGPAFNRTILTSRIALVFSACGEKLRNRLDFFSPSPAPQVAKSLFFFVKPHCLPPHHSVLTPSPPYLLSQNSHRVFMCITKWKGSTRPLPDSSGSTRTARSDA